MANKLLMAKSPEEAIGAKTARDAFLAGGTEVNRLGSETADKADTLISLKKCSGLKGISEDAGCVTIGSMTTFQELVESQKTPEWLKEAAKDQVHEPYRQKLIEGFDQIKSFMNQYKEGVFLISGSGSTCLFISDEDLVFPKEVQIQGHSWKILQVHVSRSGTYATEV